MVDPKKRIKKERKNFLEYHQNVSKDEFLFITLWIWINEKQIDYWTDWTGLSKKQS